MLLVNERMHNDMQGRKYEHVYSRKDIEKAYNMVLKGAIVVLEKFLGTSAG
jgi:hypothetical protein